MQKGKQNIRRISYRSSEKLPHCKIFTEKFTPGNCPPCGKLSPRNVSKATPPKILCILPNNKYNT